MSELAFYRLVRWKCRHQMKTGEFSLFGLRRWTSKILSMQNLLRDPGNSVWAPPHWSFRAMIPFKPEVTQIQFPTCRAITITCLRFLQWGQVWEIVKWLKVLKLNPCECIIRIKVTFFSFYLINEDQAVDGIYFNSFDTAYMFHLVPSCRVKIQIQDLPHRKTNQKLPQKLSH